MSDVYYTSYMYYLSKIYYISKIYYMSDIYYMSKIYDTVDMYYQGVRSIVSRIDATVNTTLVVLFIFMTMLSFKSRQVISI